MYPVIADPPSDVGSCQVTVAVALPAEALTLVGGVGMVAGVTDPTVLPAEPVPTLLLAVTWKV